MHDKSYVMITDYKLIGKNVLKDDEIVFASCVPGEKVDLVPTILYTPIADIPHLTACYNQEILDAISSKSRVAVVSMAAARMIGADADGDLVYLMPQEDSKSQEIKSTFTADKVDPTNVYKSSPVVDWGWPVND